MPCRLIPIAKIDKLVTQLNFPTGVESGYFLVMPLLN